MNKYMNCEYGHPLQLNLMVHARGWEKAAGIRNDRMSSGKSTAAIRKSTAAIQKYTAALRKYSAEMTSCTVDNRKWTAGKSTVESEMVESHEECLLQAVLQPVKYVAAHYCNTLLVENHSTLMDRNYKLCRMH